MLTPLVDHASMQGGCLSSDLSALRQWRQKKGLCNGDPGIMFGGPGCAFIPYYWPRVGGHYADLHNYFEASRVHPQEEAEYLNAVLDDSDVDVVTPTTDLGSLMEFENRSALCFVECDPRGDPKMSDAEWFAQEPACDHGDDVVLRDIVITRAALTHTRIGGKLKFFVSGSKEA